MVCLNLIKESLFWVWEIVFNRLLTIKKKLDNQSKKVKFTILTSQIKMNELKRGKKTRSKNALFNPYKNGISSYDLAYLSSKRVLKNKTSTLQSDFKKDLAA